MKPHRPSVLVDTNAIVECHRTGSWKAVSCRYRLETVVQCVTRLWPGRQRRRTTKQIDQAKLVASLQAVHEVSERELATLALRTAGIHLAEDEAALWAHALGRDDQWVFCGTDTASLRCGVRTGFQRRLASLERLFQDADHHPRKALRGQYTELWHRQTLKSIIAAEGNVVGKSA